METYSRTGLVATEWRGPFWEQKFWDSVVDCPKG